MCRHTCRVIDRGRSPKGVCGPNGWKFVGLEALFSFSILTLLFNDSPSVLSYNFSLATSHTVHTLVAVFYSSLQLSVACCHI